MAFTMVTSAMIATAQDANFDDRPTLSRDDVLDLVDELDAPSLSRRLSAEKELTAADPSIVPILESVKAPSIESSERLERVIESLKKIQVRTDVLTQSRPVELRGADTLADALEAISRDSGVEFDYAGDDSVSIVTTNVPLPFWHAVDLVLDAANLDVNVYGGDRYTLQLVPRVKGRPSRVDSAAYAGVYRLEPTMVTSRKSILTPELSGLNVTLQIAWQPGHTPIGLTVPIDQINGRLSDDATLKPQKDAGNIQVATTADLVQTEFFLPLMLPAGRPDTIRTMTGQIAAILPGEVKTFEIKLDDQQREKTQETMTVKIEDLRANGPLHEMRLGVTLEGAGEALQSHRQWLFENIAYVRRDDGSRSDHLGYEVYRQSSTGVGVAYLFDLGEVNPGDTLIYESATSVKPNQVEFVIQDITMP